MAELAVSRPRAVRPQRSQRQPQTLKVSSLNLKAAGVDHLIRQVERGFAFSALQTLGSQSGIAVSDLATLLGIPERTLARRRASGRFTWEESERLLRIATVFENAVALFDGDVGGAVGWLTAPRKALSGETPLNYARTEVGAREVGNLIGRLEHGVFS